MVQQAHTIREAWPTARVPHEGKAIAVDPTVAGPFGDRAEVELCRLALDSQMDAWNALIHRHNRRIVVALLARGIRIDQAKDIAQETWLRLIEQQRAGRLPTLTLPGLALAQATFIACDVARKSARVRRVEGGGDVDEEAGDIADPAADAEMRIIASQRLSRANAALEQCSKSAQAVFRLAYGEEPLSHAEVAERIGLSTQRVRQIVCEVRKLLRTTLLEENP